MIKGMKNAGRRYGMRNKEIKIVDNAVIISENNNSQRFLYRFELTIEDVHICSKNLITHDHQEIEALQTGGI